MSAPWQLEARFGGMAAVHHAVEQLAGAGVKHYEVYSPVLPHETLEAHMPRKGSPLHFFSAVGGVTGVTLGFSMCILSSLLYRLITSGKPPVSIVPFVVVGFECTILFASLATVAAFVYFARLRPLAPAPEYRDGFSNDQFGLYVQCDPACKAALIELLRAAGATDVTECVESSAQRHEDTKEHEGGDE